jgi:hypothetical protein
MNNLLNFCKSVICKIDVNNLKYVYSQTCLQRPPLGDPPKVARDVQRWPLAQVWLYSQTWPNDHLSTILKAQLQFV